MKDWKNYWRTKEETGNYLVDMLRNSCEVDFSSSIFKLDDKVLDVACGNGYYSKEVIKKAGLKEENYAGFDINSAFIEQARRFLPNARFYTVGNVKEELERIPSNSFDWCLVSSLLQYLTPKECEKILKECLRISGKIAIPNVLTEKTFLVAHAPLAKIKLVIHNLNGGSVNYLNEDFFLNIAREKQASVEFVYFQNSFKLMHVILREKQ